MANSFSSPSDHHHLAASFCAGPHSLNQNRHLHVVADLPLAEGAQRKRPKYSRSKTGCLTCRVKKIKCDEAKPSCNRCSQGKRECTWPVGIPIRKKTGQRKLSIGARLSPADSGLSESSTPPTRYHTPPSDRLAQLEMLHSQEWASRHYPEQFVPSYNPGQQPYDDCGVDYIQVHLMPSDSHSENLMDDTYFPHVRLNNPHSHDMQHGFHLESTQRIPPQAAAMRGRGHGQWNSSLFMSMPNLNHPQSLLQEGELLAAPSNYHYRDFRY